MAQKEITIKVQLDGTKGVQKNSTKVQHSIREIGEEGDKSGKQLNKMGQQSRFLQGRLGGMAAVAGGAAAAALGATLYKATERAIQKGREFQSTLAELEAITGIAGDRLDRIGDFALQLSKEYATSASDIVEAHKLVASQLAEKIDFGTEQGMQQLKDISEQAVVLKTAAGIELSEAVETTTSVMNQFNLAASESERVINTLAAGSKFGAAEVGDINRAMVNAGSAAQSANVSLEETNAAIQVLAANGQRGERAGTALRAIFTRLKTESQALAEAGIKNVNIESDGLIQTLDKLRPLLDDTTAAKKIFGEEALNQIQILIREADAVESLNEKVTGTNVAYEQSATNLDTFDAAQQNLVNTIDAALIPAFQESNGALVKLMNSVAGFVDRTASAVKWINDLYDAHSRLREELDQSERKTNLQIESMQQLRNELAKYAQEGELTAEQEEQLRKAYEATNKRLLERGKALRDETEGLKDRKKVVKETISDLKEEAKSGGISGGRALAISARLEELKTELEGLDLQIKGNEEQLDQYHQALKEGSISFEEYIEKVKQAAAAEEGRSDSNEEQQEKEEKTISTLEKKKKKLDNLLTSEQELTGAQYDRMIQLQKEISKQERANQLLEEYIRRAAEFQGVQSVDEVNQDVTVSESGLSETKVQADQLADSLQKVSSEYDSVAEAAGMAGQEGAAAIDSQKAAMDQLRDATIRATAAALARADTAKEAANEFINQMQAEIIAIAIKKALASAPFPVNIALAAGAAASVKGLFSLIPEMQRGGVLEGPSHAQGGVTLVRQGQPVAEAEGNEAIINTRSTSMFYDELSAINQAGGGRAFPGTSRMQNGGPLGPVPTRPEGGFGRSTSGMDVAVIASALRESLEGANLVAPVSISRLRKELGTFEKLQNRIGNQ